jgi:hypothetical protein
VPLGAAVVARVVCQLRGAALVRVAALRLKSVAVMKQESPVRRIRSVPDVCEELLLGDR